MSIEKDIWDDLDLDRWTCVFHGEPGTPYVSEYIPKCLIEDWANKWKPIINDAFEKAENWDKYTLNGQNITPEIIEAIEVANVKLEAIRNAIPPRGLIYTDPRWGGMVDRLRKALEA